MTNNKLVVWVGGLGILRGYFKKQSLSIWDPRNPNHQLTVS